MVALIITGLLFIGLITDKEFLTMKEGPILMKGEMIQAILAGLKTQTRRLNGLKVINESPDDWKFLGLITDEDDFTRYAHFKNKNNGAVALYKTRYIPGNRLWVRETFRYSTPDDCGCYENFECNHRSGLPIYRATYDCDENEKWRPSIYMPRWASRITLEITDVGVERVQDITEEDAKDEGAPCIKGNYFDVVSKDFIDVTEPTCRFGFHVLWDSINAPRGWGWDVNPWLWVVKFKNV